MEGMQRKNQLPPVHPGEIIREDVLPQVGLTVTGAAKALGVSRQMLHDILAERKPLSAVMCLKISRLLGSTPEFWMRLQADYDLKKATQNKDVMERVGRIVPVKPREEVHALKRRQKPRHDARTRSFAIIPMGGRLGHLQQTRAAARGESK
jgi:antitoxin HigA-1